MITPRIALSRRLSAMPASCEALAVAASAPAGVWRYSSHCATAMPTDDPSDRSPDAHFAEFTIAIDEVVKRERVRQRQCRRVNDRIQQRVDQQLRIRIDRCELPDEHRAEQMADRQEVFGVKPSIGNLPGDKRREQRTVAPMENSMPACSLERCR